MNLAILNWSGYVLLGVWMVFALSFVSDCCRKRVHDATVVGLAVLTPWLLWLVTP